jgi:hypothetical protein
MNIYEVKAFFEYRVFWRINTARYFLKLAWLSLIGKIGIMDSKEIRSVGNYKYFDFWISKLPLSDKHTYKEF